MRISYYLWIILVAVVVFAPAAAADKDSCALYNRRYANCNSFLHWNYHPSNNTVDIAYRHTGVTASNWVAWSLNPTGPRMIGAQCLVAFVNSTTGVPRPFTSPITGYDTRLQEGPLSFGVPHIAAEFRHTTSEMILYATIELPGGRTNFTHLWQHGTVSSSGAFQAHSMSPQHLSSFANIDFATGRSTIADSSSSSAAKQRLRKAHGVINVVSWGIMMPVGAMMARYVKVFAPTNPLWFYLHVSCQCLAYALGVAGLGTGLHLGKRRAHGVGVGHPAHKYLGIAIFTLATIQVLSLRLRPKPDAKWRWLWNVYHRTIGYGVIILSSANIFLGLDILDPGKTWRIAYIVFLAAIVGVALFLEVCAWVVVINRKQPQAAASFGDNAA